MKKLSPGFTLVEMVLAITLMAVALPAMLNLMGNVTVKAAQGQAYPTALNLARMIMEEIKSKRFDEATYPNASGQWSDIGVDSGETFNSTVCYGSACTYNYDDVDDWDTNAGTRSGTFIPIPSFYGTYKNYSYYVAVRYVNSDLTTFPAAGTTTNYKTVSVQVVESSSLGNRGPVLTTLVTPAQSW